MRSMIEMCVCGDVERRQEHSIQNSEMVLYLAWGSITNPTGGILIIDSLSNDFGPYIYAQILNVSIRNCHVVPFSLIFLFTCSSSLFESTLPILYCLVYFHLFESQLGMQRGLLL